MMFNEDYKYGSEGKIREIKTAVKDGETYFYLFVEGVIVKIATGDDNFGMVFPEDPINSNKHCYELKFADNKASILLKEGDSVHLESPTNKGYAIPSTLKSFNGVSVR